MPIHDDTRDFGWFYNLRKELWGDVEELKLTPREKHLFEVYTMLDWTIVDYLPGAKWVVDINPEDYKRK
jgi:hypothetical protein